MKLRTIGLATTLGAVCAVTIVGTARLARSADHLDSPATRADPTADINDLYSWMDGQRLVLALTVFPAAMAGTDASAGAKFSDRVQYVLHTSSGTAYGATTADEDVICTFDVMQKISCWVGQDEYVTGDASGTGADGGTPGLTSADGKLKVFAGLRADPFFFNLDGFKNTVQTVESVAPSLTFDLAGCPQLTPAQGSLLRTQLQTSADGGPPQDFFAPLNGLAIVVSVDKSLVTRGGAVVSTWASTHRAM